MQKIFLASGEFTKRHSRSKAYGHKNLVIEDGVGVMSPVRLHTEGTDLVMSAVEDDGTEEVYIVLCKEFGLAGYNKGIKSKISVTHLDNGWMLVTLWSGGLIIRLDDKIVMPTVDEYEIGGVVEEDIFWVDSNRLMGYRQYMGDKGNFIYDYEFMLMLKGGVHSGMSSFSLGRVDAEDIDLSLGYIAQYEQQKQMKKEAKEALAYKESIFAKATGTDGGTSYMFDDDDEFEDEDDFDDDEDDDYDFG